MDEERFTRLKDEIVKRIEDLRLLGQKLKIRSPAKLLAAARGKIEGATLELAKTALAYETSKQILAPKYRSTGKSAAEGPNQRLQGDLIDFSQNTRTKSKYALLINDVYTREVRAKPLPNKTPAAVNEAAQQLIPELVDGKQDYSITTDKGREWSNLDAAIPGQAVHREKQSMNDISVLDRAMLSLKQDMAADVADGSASNWVQALPEAVEAHNSRPHAAVFGPPEKVEENGVQDFKVLQSNAQKFLFNRNAQQRKKNALQESGAFRAPTKNRRSFEPQYGNVQMLGARKRDDPPDKVRNTGTGEFLLKEVQAVPKGSIDAAGRLTDKNVPRRLRLQERAKDLEAYISDIGGGQIQLNSLERTLRRGGVDDLYKTMRKNNITIKGFLKLYSDIFKVNRGLVTLRLAQPDAPPQPEPAVREDPEPDTEAFRALPLAERLRITDARAAARREARARVNRERLGGLPSAYAARPS
jgi:hypothetical protein